MAKLYDTHDTQNCIMVIIGPFFRVLISFGIIGCRPSIKCTEDVYINLARQINVCVLFIFRHHVHFPSSCSFSFVHYNELWSSLHYCVDCTTQSLLLLRFRRTTRKMSKLHTGMLRSHQGSSLSPGDDIKKARQRFEQVVQDRPLPERERPPLTSIGRERGLVKMQLLEKLVDSNDPLEDLWAIWYGERGPGSRRKFAGQKKCRWTSASGVKRNRSSEISSRKMVFTG
jgi:hypothetical protein